ncbi:MAG: hypothetical protein P8Y71_26470 [Pseudolabrys sp.]
MKTLLGRATGIVTLSRAQGATEKSLARTESTTGAKAAAPQTSAPQAAKAAAPAKPYLALSASETAALRTFFKLAAQYKMGDAVPAAQAKAMPDNVTAKIAAQLKGTRYAIDKNGALVVTASADNSVVLIVPPSCIRASDAQLPRGSLRIHWLAEPKRRRREGWSG